MPASVERRRRRRPPLRRESRCAPAWRDSTSRLGSLSSTMSTDPRRVIGRRRAFSSVSIFPSSCSKRTGLVSKSLAPAARRQIAVVGHGMRAQHDDRDVPGRGRRPSTARVASQPSIPGRPRSIRIRSGSSAWRRRHGLLSIDGREDAIAAARSRRRESASRLGSLSSTTMMVGARSGRSCRPRDAGGPGRLDALVDDFERKLDNERRPMSRAAFDADRSAHQLTEARHDREAQPGAAVFPRSSSRRPG